MNRPLVTDLCGEFLCINEATHELHVRELRGHVLKLCPEHARKLQQRASEEGIADKIDLRRRGS